MITIWKYELEVTDVQDIEMPSTANVLSVQVQNGVPCVWASVNTQDKQTKKVRFITIGTGNPYDSDVPIQFVGTYQLMEGKLVFHLFKEI